MSISKSQLELLKSGALDHIGELDEIKKFGLVYLDGALEILTHELRAVVTAKGLVATKVLRSSIDATDSVRVGDDIKATIVMHPKWRDVNFGTKPGKRPNLKSIEEWISAKGIPVRQGKHHSTKTVLQMRRQKAKSIQTAIFLHGTIKRFGYKGAHFVEDVINKNNLTIIADKLGEIYGEQLALYAIVPKG